MSELTILLLLCFLRAILGAVIISNGKLLNQECVLQAFSVSFLYSMLITAVLVFFFRFFLLGMGLLLNNEQAFMFLPWGYLLGAVGLIFFLELKTNQAYLQKEYSKKLINRTTFTTNFLSVVAFIFCAYLT